MKEWEKDKEWSDRFIPEIKTHLGQILICPAPFEEDALRATDMIVLKMDSVRIGCRIRRHQYLVDYGHQFTFRSRRPRGAKTELAKIVEGYGDYYFYGFADQEGIYLTRWFIAQLSAFRHWFVGAAVKLAEGQVPGETRANMDGSSDFRAFNVADMPAAFLVASEGFNAQQNPT